MAKKSDLSKDLLRIERRLQEVFQPVSPRIAFVEELRLRLDQEMVRKIKSKKVKTGLLVAGGIVGLTVMVITLIRSLTSWPKTLQSISKNLPRLRKREQVASI
jgi:hypothetical protein